MGGSANLTGIGGNMLKQAIFVVAAIFSALFSGCSGDPSGRVVHRCLLDSYELRIIREKEVLENPRLDWEVIGPDGVVMHRSGLATEHSRSYTFSSVVDKQAGIAVIVENYRPTVFVAAFDLNTHEVWPDWDTTPEVMRTTENRIAKQLENFTGRTGWSGGECVGIE